MAQQSGLYWSAVRMPYRKAWTLQSKQIAKIASGAEVSRSEIEVKFRIYLQEVFDLQRPAPQGPPG